MSHPSRRQVADEYLGDEMAAGVAEYRELLAETPVELDVNDRPTENVVQTESWVEPRLRYLVHPRRGTRTRNDHGGSTPLAGVVEAIRAGLVLAGLAILDLWGLYRLTVPATEAERRTADAVTHREYRNGP